jgi:hypothetical protein
MTAVADATAARELWPDADTIADATLDRLLGAAWEACAAFLPAAATDPMPVPVPEAWVHANVLHARDLWTAYRREGDVIGFDQYAVRVAPLAASVRALLRPARGVPMVG